MGAWGIGLFENDTACDLVSQVTHQLAGIIEEDVATLGDGVIERKAPSAAAVLVALGCGIEDVRHSLEDYDVAKWVNAYKDWVDSDQYLKAWFNPEEATAAGNAIREVFEDLLRTRNPEKP